MFKTLICAGTALTVALLHAPAATAPVEAPRPPIVSQAAATDADPALWVVQDEDTTIYLFGTVHVLKPGLSWFDEAVWAAYNQSSEIVLELVEPDQAALQAKVMQIAMHSGSPTTTEMLPEGKRAAYTKAMADAGLPVAAFDRMDPWLSAITLTMMTLPKHGYDPNSGAEKVITAAAKAAGKPISGLETAEQQLGFFDGLPQPLQVKFLESTVDELPKVGETLETMVASWSAGQPEKLGEAMNESLRETPQIAKVLLADRNARWAEWIENRMAKPGSVFIAVGAGHLAGNDSVQAFLAKRKLKAKRIMY